LFCQDHHDNEHLARFARAKVYWIERFSVG